MVIVLGTSWFHIFNLAGSKVFLNILAMFLLWNKIIKIKAIFYASLYSLLTFKLHNLTPPQLIGSTSVYLCTYNQTENTQTVGCTRLYTYDLSLRHCKNDHSFLNSPQGMAQSPKVCFLELFWYTDETHHSRQPCRLTAAWHLTSPWKGRSEGLGHLIDRYHKISSGRQRTHLNRPFYCLL